MSIPRIVSAMEYIDDDLVSGAVTYTRTKKKNSWVKWGALAACLCLIVIGAIDTLSRFEYTMSANCSAYPGEVVNGDYYYHVDHEGVYCFADGKSEKVLSTYWYDDWAVNEYGIYYQRGRTLFVQPHNSNTKVKLYTANTTDTTHIEFVLQPDGDVVVIHRNKKTTSAYEVLINGATGDLIATLTEPASYGKHNSKEKFNNTRYSIGDRLIEWVYSDEYDRFQIFENGMSILPDDLFVQNHLEPFYSEDTLILYGWRADIADDETILIVLRADKTDSILYVPNESFVAGTNEYLFYPDHRGGVYCLDLLTGDSWQLELAGESQVNMHNISTDGNYLYSCSPKEHYHECWKVEYEDKKPVRLSISQSDVTQ